MKIADRIEASEEPLEVALPLDHEAELMEHFKIWKIIDQSVTETKSCNVLALINSGFTQADFAD